MAASDFEAFRPKLASIQARGQSIVRAISFFSKEGDCHVECIVDASAPDVVNASAGRIGGAGPPRYMINVSAGIPYQAMRFASRLKTLAPELPWFHALRLDAKRAPPGGQLVDALVEHALFVMCTFVFHHELAHIYMGHVDFLIAAHDRSELFEADESPPLSSDELHALEAEADRKALVWAAGEFDRFLLGPDRLGAVGVRFPTEAAAWDLFCLSLTLLCVLMQEKNGEVLSYSHPNANERSFVMFMFLDEYFTRMKRTEAERVRLRDINTDSRLRWAGRLGLEGGATLEGHRAAYAFSSEVGATLDRMGVSAYRLGFRGGN